MAAAAPAPPADAGLRVVSVPEPGRLRLAVAGLQRSPARAREVETTLARVRGVRTVQANPLTGNVLVLFDAARWSAAQVLRRIARALGLAPQAPATPVVGEIVLRSATPGRVRLAVYGLRRQPAREPIVVAALAAMPGVRQATASAVTGTVLVEYAPADRALPALLGEMEARLRARLGAPAATGEAPAAPTAQGPAALASPSEAPTPAWHALSAAAVERLLAVDPTRGLTAAEVEARRARWGPNRLAEPAEPSLLGLVLGQFCNAPSALLGAGTVLSLATGAVLEAGLIAGVLVVNAAIGAATERSGHRAIQALRRGTAIHARVRRDGAEMLVDAAALVPGDVVLLRPGDPVPADARLFSAERLRVEESALTGESRPVEKQVAATAERTALADRRDVVYRGTTVVGGHGGAIVVATGDRTVYGELRLLALTEVAPPTPLERDLDALGRRIALGATAICAGVLGLSLLRAVGLVPAISTAVGLGVAALPEGLPTLATTVLAFGSGRMRRKGTLIRTLSAAEALGSVTHICADKTGTLTENRMAARELALDGHTVRIGGSALSAVGAFTLDGEEIAPAAWPAVQEALRIGALCSDAEPLGIRDGAVTFEGSSTEGALLVAAVKAGLDVPALRAACPTLDRRDRGDYRRHMLTVHERDGRLIALVKGSPEEVLALCDRIAIGGAIVPLTDERRAAMERRNAVMASRAMRILALAERELPAAYTEDDLRAGFVLYGLIGLVDPIRPRVPAAIAALHRAGIRTIMITGDQAPTAVAVARELGLSRRGALDTLEADDLRDVEPEALRQLVREVSIYARVPPELKLAVVRALQANGKIVAMTGDGVNDAPALRAADVGVAMGERGTELARELADVVLATDDFSRIVDAVEEGRLVRANVRRVVHYLLATNAAEVWTVLAAVAIGLPTPLNPLQLLWLNLVTDLAPALALAVEPRDPTLMLQPPRPPGEAIVPPPLLRRILGESAALALAALAVYGIGLARHGPGATAQTMAFASLVGAQLLHAPLARTGRRPATLGSPAPNRWLIAGLGVSAALQLSALFLPGLRAVLGGAPLGLADLAITGLGALAAVAGIEGERLARHGIARRALPAPTR